MASNDIEVLDPAATVEKIKKIASGVALNRRHFMAALGAAGVAAGTRLVSGPVARAQQPTPTGYAQTDVLNFLLNIKYLKGTFYSYVTQGVDLPGSSFITLGSSQVYNQPAQVSFTAFGSSASQITDMFNEMYYDDLNHLIDLRNLIEAASGTTGAAAAAVVAPRPTINMLGTSPASYPGNSVSFTIPSPLPTAPISAAQAIAVARMFEDLSVTAFAGALSYLTGANLAYAAQVLAVDGCHAAALRLTTIQTGAPYQGTYYVGPSFLISATAGSSSLFMQSTGAITTNGISHPAVGDAINGFGIPIGATVTSIASIGLTNITPSCYATAGSNILTVVGAMPSPAPTIGMPITGTLVSAIGSAPAVTLAPFTYVTGVNPSSSLATITMSQPATASSVEIPTGIFTAGTGFNGGSAPNNPNLITALQGAGGAGTNGAAGLVAGRGISAPGYLPVNTNAPGTPPNAVYISSVGATNINLTTSVPCTQSSVLTLTGSITAGAAVISNITWGPNSSGATSTLAMVQATTQPVIVGTSAAPVDPVSINATTVNNVLTLTKAALATGTTLTLTAAAAASAGNTVYTGTITGGASNTFAGATFTVSGFDNAANNGVFVATASSATSLTLQNAYGVADTHAATATTTSLLLSAAAAASGGNTVYTGTITGGASNAFAGYTFTVSNFDKAANNGLSFLATASSATSLTLKNPAGVADTAAGLATTNLTVYTGTIPGGASNAFAGATFTVAGFDNAANNGVFVATASSATTLTLQNPNGAADTAAATATTTSLALTSAAAASGGTTVYTGTIPGGASNAFAGYTFTVAGFDKSVNNGIFLATASSATSLTLQNPNGVADTAAATAASNTITGLASTTGLTAGQPIFGSNIPTGTTIKTINSASSITLSAAPTASSTYIVIASVLSPNTTVSAANANGTISLSAPALSSYTGPFTIPWPVPITFVSVTTASLTIGRSSISISELATATGAGTATIVSPAGDPDEVAPVDPGVGAATPALAAATSAAGPAPLSFVTSGTLTNIPPGVNRGFFATAGALNNSAATPAGFAFARTFSQVLSVLYGNSTPGTYDGGYFPTFQPNGDSTNTFGGVSGTITMV